MPLTYEQLRALMLESIDVIDALRAGVVAMAGLLEGCQCQNRPQRQPEAAAALAAAQAAMDKMEAFNESVTKAISTPTNAQIVH